MKSNVSSCNEMIFKNGNKVYYKRKDSPRWRGPGIVIGQHSKEVLVKHGHEVVRVHTSRIIHVGNIDYSNKESNNDNSIDEKTLPYMMKLNTTKIF